MVVLVAVKYRGALAGQKMQLEKSWLAITFLLLLSDGYNSGDVEYAICRQSLVLRIAF